MERIVWYRFPKSIAVIALMAALFLFVSPVPAVGVSTGSSNPLSVLPEINSSVSVENMSIPLEYRSSPAPVTVFNAEVTETALPGPREMAFGPRQIRLSLDPITLGIVLSVIVVMGMAIAFILYRRRYREG